MFCWKPTFSNRFSGREIWHKKGEYVCDYSNVYCVKIKRGCKIRIPTKPRTISTHPNDAQFITPCVYCKLCKIENTK